MDTTTGNGSWTEVTQTASGTENKIRCDGLKPLHKYRFRVKAVNKIGISDPGEMKTDPDPPINKNSICIRPNRINVSLSIAEYI